MAKLQKTLKVEIGAPGRGKNKRRLPITSPKKGIDANTVCALLVNAQLDVHLECDPNAATDVDGQETMDHAASDIYPIDGTVDVKRVNVGPDDFRFALIFSVDTDPAKLDAMAFQPGTLKCRRIGDASSEEAEADSV